MRKLIWTIVIVVLLIVIFLLASPVYYGKQTEFFVKRAVKTANQRYSKYGVTVSVANYKRSWYSANAVIDIAIHNASVKKLYQENVDPSFNVKNPLVVKEVLSLSHGPVLYHGGHGNWLSAAYVSGHIAFPSALLKHLNVKVPLIRFDGSVSYTGGFTGHIVMAPIHYASKTLTFDFNGSSVNGSIDAKLQHFSGSSTTQPMKMLYHELDPKTGGSVKFTMSAAHDGFDYKRLPSGLWVISSKGHVKHLMVMVNIPALKGQKPLNVMNSYQNLTTEMSTAVKNHLYQLHYRYAYDQFKSSEFPKVVNNGKMHFSLSGLNSKAILKAQAIFYNYLVSFFQAGPTDAVTDQLISRLGNISREALTKHTALKLHVSGDLPKGPVNLDLAVEAPNYDKNMPIFETLMLLEGQASVSVSQSLVQHYLGPIRTEYAAALKRAKAKVAALPPLEPGPVMTKKNREDEKFWKAHLRYLKEKRQRNNPALLIPRGLRSQYMGVKQFDQAKAKGFIVLKDDHYESKATYSHGKLTVNGKKVDL